MRWKPRRSRNRRGEPLTNALFPPDTAEWPPRELHRVAVVFQGGVGGVTIRRYSVFSGKVIDRRSESRGTSPHYYILLEGNGQRFRVAVNTRSGTTHSRKSDLLYFADDDFRHDVTRRLAAIDEGEHYVESRPGGLALDYQRGGMFDRRHMRRIPTSRPGPGNDLVDELDLYVERLLTDSTSRLHAYGTRWGPESDTADQVFGFTPGNGIHDVHMNQGNRDEHWHDNGIWSDGGLIFQWREPNPDRWSAIFLAFQAQSWHTDNRGHPTPYPERDDRGSTGLDDDRTSLARIVSAFVDPNDETVGVEHVSIRNDSHEPLAVRGWRLLNRDGDATVLDDIVPPHTVRRFELRKDVPLSSRGGVIRTLRRQRRRSRRGLVDAPRGPAQARLAHLLILACRQASQTACIRQTAASPNNKPPATSDGQCTPRRTRESAMRAIMAMATI